MRFKILGAMLLASAAASFGAIQINSCDVDGTSIQVTSGVNSNTSILCGDKLFNGFSTNLTDGTYTVTVLRVDGDQYKVTLAPAVGIGSFTSGFNFNYTVSVSGTDHMINSIQDQMFTSSVIGNSIPNASTAEVTHSAGITTNLNAITAQGQTGYQTLLASSTSVGLTYNPTGSVGQPTGKLLSMEWLITETAVPEPGSMALMGAGLVGLGVLARRRRK